MQKQGDIRNSSWKSIVLIASSHIMYVLLLRFANTIIYFHRREKVISRCEPA